MCVVNIGFFLPVNNERVILLVALELLFKM